MYKKSNKQIIKIYGLILARMTIIVMKTDYYDGKFVDGLANDDHSEYYFADKDRIYYGDFKDGKIEGKGVYDK